MVNFRLNTGYSASSRLLLQKSYPKVAIDVRNSKKKAAVFKTAALLITISNLY